jgi:hypothetical protein
MVNSVGRPCFDRLKEARAWIDDPTRRVRELLHSRGITGPQKGGA